MLLFVYGNTLKILAKKFSITGKIIHRQKIFPVNITAVETADIPESRHKSDARVVITATPVILRRITIYPLDESNAEYKTLT